MLELAKNKTQIYHSRLDCSQNATRSFSDEIFLLHYVLLASSESDSSPSSSALHRLLTGLIRRAAAAGKHSKSTRVQVEIRCSTESAPRSDLATSTFPGEQCCNCIGERERSLFLIPMSALFESVRITVGAGVFPMCCFV